MELQLIYENILGLATAGVVTVLPSAEELSEGLSHLSLSLHSDTELSACLWLLEAALQGAAPSYESFLAQAEASVGAPLGRGKEPKLLRGFCFARSRS
ncbi:unnamed protein product [Effrenium voratum]|nr:unnamed protein product [Effrenium voratum]